MKIIELIILMIILIMPVSAGEIVENVENSDINGTEYVNPNDYYIENDTRINYVSDTGSFNNVTMSNGYNAYSIQDGGWIETNDSKTHPSFWGDKFECVDANDTSVVIGHWYYNPNPIGEYLKILIFNHLNDYKNIDSNIPGSIYLQSAIWDIYKNGENADVFEDVFQLYNQGYRVNNTGNKKWINETHYEIYDFLGFKNLNGSHNDLWGFRITLGFINSTSDKTSNEEKNSIEINNKTSQNRNPRNTNKTGFSKQNFKPQPPQDKISLKNTGNPIWMLIFLLCLISIKMLDK